MCGPYPVAAMEHRPTHRRTLVGACVSVLAAVGAVLAVALTTAACASAKATRADAPTPISVSSSPAGPPVAAGFVGLATEYWDVEKEVGTDPSKPDDPFEQIVRNLAPYGGVTLRIGGDSTDWTWWPVPGMKQPPWVRWTMTPTWAAVTKKLADDLHAHLIVGINMEADSTTVASTEVHEIASNLGSVPTTYEIGNEPELYSKFAFYNDSRGQPVRGRPKSYSSSDITDEWNRLAGAVPGVRLAGPGYSALKALPDISQFLDSARKLSLLTVHSYPLRSPRCGGHPQESQLFQPATLQELADEVGSWTDVARGHGIPVRIDEMNSVTCGGLPHFSDTFGPALWALNILPLYAEAGAQGVNFQTRPFTAQNLIQTLETHSGWHVQVQPEYYGLLAFAQLTPPGSRLLQVTKMPNGLYAWAVRTPSGQTHVVVTNITASASTVGIHADGARGAATIEALQAASGGLNSAGRVTLGGQTISSSTGKLSGTPVTTTLLPSQGTYDVKVPAASAAIITLPR
jgi:Glycosyl hydrolase family 79 C-terminal beta domain